MLKTISTVCEALIARRMLRSGLEAAADPVLSTKLRRVEKSRRKISEMIGSL